MTATTGTRLVANGAAIEAERLERGYSTTELARRAGISQPHMSRIELGQQGCSARVLKQIADALELPVSRITRAKPRAANAA
jgi:transcriptional regulator with XRE-family HTH domain